MGEGGKEAHESSFIGLPGYTAGKGKSLTGEGRVVKSGNLVHRKPTVEGREPQCVLW